MSMTLPGKSINLVKIENILNPDMISKEVDIPEATKKIVYDYAESIVSTEPGPIEMLDKYLEDIKVNAGVDDVSSISTKKQFSVGGSSSSTSSSASSTSTSILHKADSISSSKPSRRSKKSKSSKHSTTSKRSTKSKSSKRSYASTYLSDDWDPKERELKSYYIEQINQLTSILANERIQFDPNVKNLTISNSLKEIESALNILKNKNSSYRYSNMANELVLGFSYALSSYLNGRRKIPIIEWAPDYSNFYETIQTKLSRMRFETSSIVGDIIQRNGIGAGWKILLELLPSFILFPLMKTRNTSRGLEDQLVREAFSNIQDRRQIKKL